MKNKHQNLLLKVFGVLMIFTLKSPMRYCIVLQYYLHFIIYKKITHEKSIRYKNQHDVRVLFLILYVYRRINERERKKKLHDHPQAWDLQ